MLTSHEYEAKIEELEDYIRKMTKVLNEITDKEKYVCTVLSGPAEHNDTTYYRVAMSGAERMVSYNENLIFNGGVPKEGQEVVVREDSIIAIIPKELVVRSEQMSTTKLVTWEEIGGMKSQIQQIRQAVETPLKYADLAKEMGIEPIKGILLHGPTGCGKTLIAKAVARTILEDAEADRDAFIYVKGPELLNKYIGESERMVRARFAACRKYSAKTGKRAVMFIDEAESLLPARGTKLSSDVETTIVPQFLAEMDGFAPDSPIVILATNLPSHIDSAILREGRIDLKVLVDRPNVADTTEIFGIHLKGVKCAQDIEVLAKVGMQLIFASSVSERVSGAMVKTMVNLAAQKAMQRVIAGDTKNKGVIEKDLELSRDQLILQ